MNRVVRAARYSQERIERRLRYLGEGKYAKVLKKARKPTTEEYQKTCLVTGIGMMVIGAIGYLIYLGFTWLPDKLKAWWGI